jgi:hypothetical protein
MKSQTSLRKLERNIFRETHRDGVIDILIGCLLLMFVIAPLLSSRLGDFWSSAIFLPFWLAIYLGLRAIKKAHILPRIGKVEYSSYRKKRLRNINMIILIFNLVALGLGILAYFNFQQFQGWVPFSILMLVGFSLAGFMIESPRLYIYGILTASAPMFGEYLYKNHGFSHHGFPVTFGILSAGIILIGLALMVNIFRRYPLPDQKDLEW